MERGKEKEMKNNGNNKGREGRNQTRKLRNKGVCHKLHSDHNSRNT